MVKKREQFIIRTITGKKDIIVYIGDESTKMGNEKKVILRLQDILDIIDKSSTGGNA